MTELRIGDQLIRYDRESTTSAYSQIKESMTDRCGCPECRNFAMQWDKVFTQGFKAFMADLGIDSRKEAEACPEGVIQDGFLPFGGWFNLTGELIEAGEGLANVADVQCFFRRNSCQETAVFGPSAIALEFVMLRVPRVLAESPSFDRKRSKGSED